ncbi:hypothetical protein AVEN_154505-1, partial [Araneus ventricosus]
MNGKGLFFLRISDQDTPTRPRPTPSCPDRQTRLRWPS